MAIINFNSISGVSTISVASSITVGNVAITTMSITATTFSGNLNATSGPVLVGSGTSTGTASQPLQVTGGAYVSGNLGIGTTNPAVSLDLKSKTDAIALPQGTTAQRPSGNAPYIRYNTTNSALELYNGTDWVEIISDYFPTGSVILG